MSDLLTLQKVSAGYGDAIVISNIDLHLKSGESLAVLGRNGTGKTTLLNTIIGVTRHRGGSIMLDGQDLATTRSDKRAHAGIGWVPKSVTSSSRSPWRRISRRWLVRDLGT